MRVAGADALTPDGMRGTRARIYAVVARIPRGRVATYGQIALLAGLPGQARQVGYALAALPSGNPERIPWQRVLNAKGEVSPRRGEGRGTAEGLQRSRLEREGVRFDAAGRLLLAVYRWRPRK
jgi:methylated-DNA-protein-cysteine methyltransferase-like protein